MRTPNRTRYGRLAQTPVRHWAAAWLAVLEPAVAPGRPSPRALAALRTALTASVLVAALALVWIVVAATGLLTWRAAQGDHTAVAALAALLTAAGTAAARIRRTGPGEAASAPRTDRRAAPPVSDAVEVEDAAVPDPARADGAPK